MVFQVPDSELRASAFLFRCFRFRVSGSGFRICGSGSRVQQDLQVRDGVFCAQKLGERHAAWIYARNRL